MDTFIRVVCGAILTAYLHGMDKAKTSLTYAGVYVL